MKNKKIIAIAGACLIASSAVFTGCSKTAEETETTTIKAEETTAEETEETTSESEETSDDRGWRSPSLPEDISQLSEDDLMSPVPMTPMAMDESQFEGIGYEGYFGYEPLDELAIQYREEDYLVYDIGFMSGGCGFWIGDEDRYFNTGFYASNIAVPGHEEIWDDCYILIMTQEMFDTYIVPTYVSADASYNEEDGVIYYNTDYETISYDPDTMICSIIWKNDINAPVCPVDPGTEYFT